MMIGNRSLVLRYGAAVLCVAMATLARLMLNPMIGSERVPFITYFLAVVISAWLGGLGPALLVVILGSVLAAYFFIPPENTLFITDLGDILSLGIFIVIGACIALLSDALHRARLRAEENAVALHNSEQSLLVTIKSIGDAVIATDLRGRVTLMNPVAQELTGWDLESARGKPLGEVFKAVNERTREPIDDPVSKALEDGRIVGLSNHTILLDRAGREVPIDDSAAPIRGDGGEIIGAVLIFRDMTERRRSQESLVFLAEASSMLASSPDYEPTLQNVARLTVPFLADYCVIYIVEDDGEVNRVAAAHSDSEKESLLAELHEYPFDIRKEEGIAGMFRTGEPLVMPKVDLSRLERVAYAPRYIEIVRALNPVSAMVVPLIARERTIGAIGLVTSESGRQYGASDLALAEEIARRAALVIDNARLYREAQEANRSKDEFLATVSHELRTPLNAILGWSHMLRSGEFDPEARSSALETIERNARAQAQIVEDILDVSRIITGRLHLDARPVDLPSVIESAVNSIRPAAEAKQIQVTSVLDSKAGPVLGDPTRLQQIIWNLLSNAVKFTPRGGRIQVHLERIGSHVEIVVSDTGQGIAAGFLPHVFDRFKQADSSTTRRHGGLGLGLAIVRHLVEMHGGSVSVESGGEGQGASFGVSLPLMAVRAEAAAPEADRRNSPGPTGLVSAPSLEGLRLLAVDDEPDTRELLVAALAYCGAEVHGVASVSEALALIEEWKPHVIISDIEMPDEDGYELIRRLRSLGPEQGGTTPVVALTAYARKEDRMRALSAGFHMHVAKPVEPTELAVVVATLARRNHSRS